MVQQWNASQKNSDITLSGSPSLTATMTTTSNYATVYAAESNTTGKFYWEMVLTGTGVTAGDSGAGIGNIASSTALGQYLGIGTDTLGWFAGGNVYSNATSNGLANTGWATYTTPAHLCFALDMVNKLIWGRVTNGNWNANASANPATGTLGTPIPSTVYAAAVVPGATVALIATPDTAAAVFAQASWTYVTPAGFGPFDPSYQPVFRPQSIQIWDH